MCGQSVHERLRKLGVQCDGGGRSRKWTPEEDAILRSDYIAFRARGEVRKLADRLGRNYFTLAARAGKLGLAAPRGYEKPYARKIKTEAEARRIFNQFKKSSLGLLQFCAKTGLDDELLRRHIATRWPDEWDAVIESKTPKQTRYRLGRAFEYQTRDLFREHGYFVLRSPRSGSPVDLVAIKKGRIAFIQCKRSGCIVSKEWNALFDLAQSVGAVAVLAERPTGRGIVLWEMLGKKDGVKRAQPRRSYEL